MKILDKELKNIAIGLLYHTLCKEEFIGGCDIVKEMFEKGELKNFLKQKNYLTIFIKQISSHLNYLQVSFSYLTKQV